MNDIDTLDYIAYAPSTGGFYVYSIHGDTIPSDAVQITEEHHTYLLDGQAEGLVITLPDADHTLPWLSTPPPPPPLTPEEEKSMAQAAAGQILMTRLQTQAARTEVFSAAEFGVLARAGLFPDWTPGAEYVRGDRLVFGGIVYEVQQRVSALDNQPPDGAGMLAVYRPLSVDAETGAEPDGGRDNPFSFISGMDVLNGKHYTFEGRLYLARADMPACVWNPGTAGLWQWEAVGQGG